MSQLPLTTKYTGVLRELSAAEASNLDERGIPKHLGPLQRKVQLSGYDKETNTVTMAVSSSTPVERYFGAEILSHDAGAIDTSRLKTGIPLLFNHDYDAHLGRSTDFKMGDPLHVTCRFGANPLALEKAGDVDTGILVDVSIGYIVDEWDIVENAKTGERTYTATKWTLLEVSLVTVPADPTVGVGRSSDPAPNVRSFRKVDDDGEEVTDEDDDDDDAEDEGDRSQPAAQAPTLDPPSTTNLEAQRTATMDPNTPASAGPDLAAANETRVAGLRLLRTTYPEQFTETALNAAIALDLPLENAKRAIADAVIAASQRTNLATVGDEVFGSMSARERSKYSMRNVIAAAINQRNPGTFGDEGAKAAFEREVSDELRKVAAERQIEGLGGGIVVPSATTRAAFGLEQRTIASGGNAGTFTNFTEVESNVIELLRSRVYIMALGAQMLSGLKGKIQMPRQNSSASSSWLAEAGAVSNSDLGFDDIILSPNRLSIQNSYYRDFFAQTAIAIDPLLAQDRMQVLARSLNAAVVAGSGTAPVPKGLLNQSGLAAVLAGTTRAANGTVTAGAGGVPLTYVDLNAMEAAIATSNGDIGTLRWLTTPKVRAAGRSTPKTPGTATDYIWPASQVSANGLQPGPLGYEAMCTSDSVLTGFTANSVSGLHAAILGVWDQILIGDWGLSEIIVDNVTGAAAAKVIITEHAFYDTNVRHIPSFVACTSALPS